MRLRDFFLKLFILTLLVIFGYGNGYAVINPNSGPDIARETAQEKGKKAEYKEGELLVKFKPDTSEKQKKNLHKRHGSEKIKEFPSLRIQHVKLKKGMTVEEAVALYSAEPDVEYAEPNLIVSILTTPNDPRFGELWGLHNIDAPEAWDIATGSSDVVVAVIDTGVDYNHEDLSANMWVNPGEIPANGVDDDGNGYIDDIYGIDAINNDSDPFDDNGHGTHVSGTIGAVGDNGIGVAGVNWDVQIIACKFLGSSGWGDTADAVECLQYIKGLRDSGINIVATNNSWGGGGYSQTLYDAINAQREILFMAAAGNSALDTDSSVHYPSSYYLPNLLAVSATDQNDALASFSNYGRRTVHIGAPGVSILSSLPGNSYDSWSGTSMATPHVSGLAALLKASDPLCDWIDIRNLILSGSNPIANLDGKTVTGARLNAHNSLACADRPVFSALKIPASLTVGVPSTVSVLSINCSEPAGPVSAFTSGGVQIDMRDDGIDPDMAAGDGIFTGTFTPVKTIEKISFSSGAGAEDIVIPALKITNNSLYDGIIGYPYPPYTQSLSATGGLTPYTWAIASGALPPGITLDQATGRLAGTPTATGAYSFTAQVTDSYGITATKFLYINVGPVQIATTSLPNARLNSAYSQTLASRGGQAPFVWSITAGSLPPGLAFNSATGAITGTPSLPGQFNFTVRLDEGYGTNASQALHVTVLASGLKQLWSRTFNAGGNEYADGIAADSGSGNVYITGGTLSGSTITVAYDWAGNQLWNTSSAAANNSTDVKIDPLGNPTVARNYNGFSIAKYDPSGNLLWTKSNMYSWNDDVGGMDIDPQGNIYLSGWYWSGSTPTAATIKYDSSGNVIWSRTYRHEGNATYGMGTAVDGEGNVYVSGFTNFYGYVILLLVMKYDASGNLLWVNTQTPGGDCYPRDIAVGPSGSVYVTGYKINNQNEKNDYLTLKYDQEGNRLWYRTYDSGGGDSSFGVALDAYENVYVAGYSDGTGMLVYDSNGNVINDSGAAARAYDVSLDQAGNIYVANQYNNGSNTDYQAIKYAPLFMIMPASLPSATRDAPYNQSLQTLNGAPPYVWGLATGSLPPGLALNETEGIIEGIPSATGVFNFAIQSVDSAYKPALKYYSITVYAPPLDITTSSLPYGTTGFAYTETLTATGGMPPYAWSVSSGSLPPGLALNSSTGDISGTPTTAGTFNFTVIVTDAASGTDTKGLSISVYDPLSIVTSSLPDGIIGIAYSGTLSATGGKTPYTWSLASGSLPPGLALNSSTGEISGTPTATGTFNFTARITDANASTADKALSIAVYAPLSVTTSFFLPQGDVCNAYTQTLAAEGGLTPYTWSIISGSLPDGLTLDSSTGGISGISTVVGTFNFTVRVTDASSNTAEKSLAMIVHFQARISGTSLDYLLLGDAYYGTPDGGTLDVPAMSVNEDLTFDHGTVILRGGYDCNFNANPSYTTIDGNIINSLGTITLEKIKLKGTLTITGGTVIPDNMIIE